MDLIILLYIYSDLVLVYECNTHICHSCWCIRDSTLPRRIELLHSAISAAGTVMPTPGIHEIGN